MNNATMRRIILSAALSLLPSVTWAQDQGPDQPVSVYFEPLKGDEFTRLNTAILNALAAFQLEAKPGARTVIVSVPDRVDVQHKQNSGTVYGFTIAFSRDGHSLGESQQSCGADKLSDCTDQIVLDVKSAAAPR